MMLRPGPLVRSAGTSAQGSGGRQFPRSSLAPVASRLRLVPDWLGRAAQRHPSLLMGSLVWGAAVLVYANSLFNGFALDDGAIIAANARIHTLSAPGQLLLTPYWPHFGFELGLYRPVTVFLFALQWAAGEGQPWVFHLLNVVLHAGVSVLVFLLLARFVGAVAAGVGGLLFALHPLHTEAVANVVGQAELVAAVAVCAACLIHARRPAGTAVGWPRRISLVVLFILGVGAKESAVIMPGLLVLVDLAQQRIAPTRASVKQYADDMFLPLFLILAAFLFYALLRFQVLDGHFLGVDAGPQLGYLKEHRILNAIRAFPEYARLLFFPARLSADYHPAVVLPVDSITPMVTLGMLLLAGSAILGLLSGSRPLAGLPAGWFLIALLPVSNLLFPVGILIAERALYLPSVAVAMAGAFGWQYVSVRTGARRRHFLVLGLGAVLISLGLRTWVRNPVWASTSAVLTSVARDRPESYRAQWNLAATELGHRNYPRAALHYEAAYRIYPHDSEFLTEYAQFLIGHQGLPRGVAMLETAYRMHPQILRTVSLLASAYLASGRFVEALPMISRMEQLGADRGPSMAMRAYAYEQLGRSGLGAAAWRIAVREPGQSTPRNWCFLARALVLAGFPEAAAEAAREAAKLATTALDSALVAGFRGALLAGCYDAGVGAAPSPGARSAVLLRPALPKCDVLGDWLFSTGSQSATPLQNATPGEPSQVVRGGAGPS